MNIYYLSIVIIHFIYLLTISKYSRFYNNKYILYFVTIAVLVFVQTMRSPDVGVDLYKKGGYYPFFESMETYPIFGPKLYKFEWGFILLTGVIAKATQVIPYNFQLFLLVVSVLSIVPIMFVNFKKSYLFLVSTMIFILFGFYTLTFSGLRQSIALGLVYLSSLYIEKSDDKLSWKSDLKDNLYSIIRTDIFKFYALIFIASIFHKSALIFILGRMIYNYSFSKLSFKIYSLFLVAAFLFKGNIVQILSVLTKGRIKLEQTGAFKFFLILLIITYVIKSIVLYQPQIQKFMKKFPVFERNLSFDSLDLNYYGKMSNLLLFATFIQTFAMVSFTVSRFGYYFYYPIMILVPNIFYEVIRRKRLRVIIYILFLIVGLFYFHRQTGGGYLEINQYSFFWDFAY